MIDHEFGDYAQIPLIRRINKCAKIIERAEVLVDVEIIGDVVPVVAERRGIEWQQPDGGDAELLEIIQLFNQTTEVAHPVAVAVAEGLDVQLVDDRVLVPERIDSCFVPIYRHAANLCRTNRTVQLKGFWKTSEFLLLASFSILLAPGSWLPNKQNLPDRARRRPHQLKSNLLNSTAEMFNAALPTRPGWRRIASCPLDRSRCR